MLENYLIDGLHGHYDWNAVGQYDPSITPTYFDTDGTLHKGSTGNIQVTPTGGSTNYSLGLLYDAAYGLSVTKCMFYSFGGAGGASTSYGGGGAAGGQGMIVRTIRDKGSVGQYRFVGISGGPPSNRTQLDNVGFDLTQEFSRLSKDSYGRINYYWFPKINFNLISNGGSFVIGNSGDTGVDFEGFRPQILSSFYVAFSGSGIGAIGFDASIRATEFYEDVYFLNNNAKTNVAKVGDVISIVCPASNLVYDAPGMRSGFTDLTSVQFTGAAPVTNFAKLASTSGVIDTVQLQVPTTAKTGLVTLTSVFNTNNTANSTDVFNVVTPLIIN